MSDEKIQCDNCGSAFSLTFDEDDVSYSPSHCPFCGDYYDATSEELDFNKEDDGDFYKSEELDDLLFDDDDN